MYYFLIFILQLNQSFHLFFVYKDLINLCILKVTNLLIIRQNSYIFII